MKMSLWKSLRTTEAYWAGTEVFGKTNHRTLIEEETGLTSFEPEQYRNKKAIIIAYLWLVILSNGFGIKNTNNTSVVKQCQKKIASIYSRIY